MTERQYLDYIQDIVESVNDIESFVSNMDFDAFEIPPLGPIFSEILRNLE